MNSIVLIFSGVPVPSTFIRINTYVWIKRDLLRKIVTLFLECIVFVLLPHILVFI